MILRAFRSLLILSVAIFFTASVHAGPSAEVLSACLTNSTTGKDRMNIAKWVFASLAQHPEVASISNITPEKLDEINKAHADVYTRLITIDCNKEAKEVVNLENAKAMRDAFGVLGRQAIQELIGNSLVNTQLTTAQEKYVDMEKLRNALK